MATSSPHPNETLAWRRSSPVWLGIAMVAVGLVTTVYLFTHGHPAFEGGLYLQIVEEIQAHGFGLPHRIPHYTAGGIPFAYPPLMFYALAGVVTITGVDPVWLMTVLPALGVIAYLVPYYVLAEELLATPRRAGFATLLFGVAPPVLQWHLSAGGVVRAPAMFLTLTGIYTGLQLFRGGETRWLVASTVLWALVMLSHPVYTAFFGWSYLVLFVVYDRSLVGLIRGTSVAIGGFALTPPWWLLVGSRHGFDVFLAALDSRSSLGGGSYRFVSRFVWPLTSGDLLVPFFALAFFGAAYALYRRRVFLPVWLVSTSYLIGKQRLMFVAGAMAATIVVFEALGPAVGRLGAAVDRRQALVTAVILLLATGATGIGAAYAGSGLDTVHRDSSSLPETVDAGDRRAMDWARTNTAQSADFIVLGDTAEWFPYYAKRTILVSPWGTEWTDQFVESGRRYHSMSTCEDLHCLEADVRSATGSPEYIYISTETYTVQGAEHAPRRELLESLIRSEEYDLRYATQGVMIFEPHAALLDYSEGAAISPQKAEQIRSPQRHV